MPHESIHVEVSGHKGRRRPSNSNSAGDDRGEQVRQTAPEETRAQAGELVREGARARPRIRT
eukprot:4161491-Alexandrium_andersonii.AAC.1